MEDIKIVEVVTQEITKPEDDGTPGSALYAIPFKLNRTPSKLWSEIFVRVWDSPPSFSTMHCPGIARVVGDRIILDGTTVEEVKSTHKKTLELCVSEVNRMEAAELKRRKEKEEAERDRSASFRKDVEEKAKGIEFD